METTEEDQGSDPVDKPVISESSVTPQDGLPQTPIPEPTSESIEQPSPVGTGAFTINLDDIEKEVENETDEDISYNFDWRKDFDEIEKAINDDVVEYDEEEKAGVATELEQVRTALEQDGISPDKILEDFYLEIESDVLQVTSMSAEELKVAEENRIQAELERVRHEAEIQRRREAVLDERAMEAKKELHEDSKKKQQLLQQKKDLMILKGKMHILY